MTDKHLTESSWKSFAKGGDYKDAPLLKALAALSKAEREGPQAVLDALDDLDKQVKTLRSAHKGSKDLTGYLDKVDKAAEAQRKDSQKELKEAETADDEEEESPALLTSKLVPLIKQVRKGEVVMKAMIVTTGKDTAVMLSKRAIAPTRSKLLKEYLGASGGVKTILGDCLLEENAITFVVQSQAAGLAKKLKAALMAQTELRLKIRVRGEDPDDLDEEGEEGEAGDAAQPQGGAGTDAAQPDTLQAKFDARLVKLEPLIAAALRAQRGDVTKIRAVSAFAREKGQGGDPAAGLKALDVVEQLLRAAALSTAPDAGKPLESKGDATVDPAAAFQARLTALLPRIKDFMASAGERGQEAKLKVGEAGALARKREFDAAHALLDETEQLMSKSPSRGDELPDGGGGEKADDKVTQARDLLERLQTLFEQARAGRSVETDDQLATLQKALNMAAELLEAGDAGRALLILNRIEQGGQLKRLLDGVAESRDDSESDDLDDDDDEDEDQPSAPASLRRQRTFMLEVWKRIPGRLRASLADLQQALVAMGDEADEDPAELVGAIAEELDTLLDDIQDQMDDAITAGDPNAFRGLRERAEADPLLNHLANDPSGASAGLLMDIVNALDEIEKGMVGA